MRNRRRAIKYDVKQNKHITKERIAEIKARKAKVVKKVVEAKKAEKKEVKKAEKKEMKKDAKKEGRKEAKKDVKKEAKKEEKKT